MKKKKNKFYSLTHEIASITLLPQYFVYLNINHKMTQHQFSSSLNFAHPKKVMNPFRLRKKQRKIRLQHSEGYIWLTFYV